MRTATQTSFRVRFQGWVVNVNVWPDKRSLVQHYRKKWGGKGGAEAFCQSFERRYVNGRKTREIAEVNFCIGYIGTFVFTHEFTHAGLALLRRRGWMQKIDEASGNSAGVYEEYLCDAVGEFTRQAVNKLYQLKLI